MINRLMLLVAALLAVPVLWVSAPVAYAAVGNTGQICTGDPNNPNDPASSAFCKDSAAQRSNGDNPLTGPNGLIMKVVNLIAIIAGAAAVIIIILAGLRYIQSGGNSEDVAGARRTIIYAIVGIIVIVLARSIIALVVKGL